MRKFIAQKEFLRLRRLGSLATVDGVIFQHGKILLTKRAIEPFKNSWVLPGGHIEKGESPERAALREVREETGLKTHVVSFLNVYSDPKRDPRGHTVSSVYVLKHTSSSLKRTSEVSESRFFAKNEVPRKIGFDHKEIIEDAFRFLNKKSVKRRCVHGRNAWIPEKDFRELLKNFTLSGAGGIVIDDGKVLLSKRSIELFKNSWVIPGGFVQSNESAERTALREVQEETGLKTRIVDCIGAYHDNDPRGSTVVNIFLLKRTSGSLRTNSEDNELRYFSRKELPREIGFNHRKILKDAFKIIEQKS